jgi:hypothetical protein
MALPRKTRRRQKHQVDMHVNVRDITKAGTSRVRRLTPRHAGFPHVT